ncbi:translation initiation factor IF-2-like [Phoenix dactylifera]|uniref:Translation initiation factor IF-2-like n=1 Tax=Phoenix dactylifera TaxID=42345 RepID=A0A8B8J0C3_PHODC|nr:translation initiation factor IF-2-like [Phoenix dactylifera]
MADGEIIVVPFHSSGHIFPAIELANHLASRNHRIALLLPTTPSDASLHPLIRIVEFSMPHPPGAPPGPPQPFSSTSSFSSSPSGTPCSSFDDFLARRFDGDDPSPPPICAIVDVMMSHLLDICREFQIPVVSLFTSSACCTALDHAMSKLSMEDLGPGRTVTIPGLPEEMALTSQDLNQRPGHPGARPPMFGPDHGGPPPHFGPGRGDVRPPGPPPPFGPGRFGVPPPPLRQGEGGAPPPPPCPGHQEGPPPSPRRGPPPPPPFGHGHCGGPPAPPTSAGGGPHPTPPLRPGDGGAPRPPPPWDGHGHHPPPPPVPGHGHFAGPPPPPFGHGQGCRPSPPPPDRIGPGHGGGPPGLADTEGAIALLFNTCDDLERPFLDYLAKQTKKPVWGVGPLLPAAFWSAAGSLVHDAEVRPQRGDSSVSERDVLEWLDSKPPGSVIYVSFGSIGAPSDAELAELGAGLEESNRPFIWAIQPNAMQHDPAGLPVQTDGSFLEPEGLASRVGGRGLVIRGWAPQLLILSHGATGGFVTHCGWNSTVEALGCGVPMLTWPLHGDQFHNARLVTRRLRAGIALKSGSESVSKDGVLQGIERLMVGEEEVRERAASAREIFAGGFPRTSSASLDAFLDFIHHR